MEIEVVKSFKKERYSVKTEVVGETISNEKFTFPTENQSKFLKVLTTEFKKLPIKLSINDLPEILSLQKSDSPASFFFNSRTNTCYSALRKCVKSGFKNGYGKEFASTMIDSIIKDNVCCLSKVKENLGGETLFGANSYGFSGAGNDSSMELKEKKRKRFEIDNHNKGDIFDVVFLCPPKNHDEEYLCLPKIVVEVENVCENQSTYGQILNGIKQVLRFAILSYKESDNQPIVMSVLCPLFGLVGLFSPKEGNNITFYAVRIGTSETFNPPAFARYLQVLEYFICTGISKDLCRTCGRSYTEESVSFINP